MTIKFWTVASNNCGCSVWNLLHGTILELEILRWFLDLKKMVHPWYNHQVDDYKSRGKAKGKAIPLEAWTGSYGRRNLRFPDFLDIRHMKETQWSPTGIEHATFRLAAHCLNQLHHNDYKSTLKGVGNESQLGSFYTLISVHSVSNLHIPSKDVSKTTKNGLLSL